MTVLSSQTIRKLKPILDIKERTEININGIRTTYGLSAAGYDLRLDQDLEIKSGNCCLASATELFDMPNNIIGYVHDKSSLARRFITVQNTVIEPGWKGQLTLEIINHSEKDINLFRGMGIAQVVFHFLDEETEQPYDGKYQHQKGVTEAI